MNTYMFGEHAVHTAIIYYGPLINIKVTHSDRFWTGVGLAVCNGPRFYSRFSFHIMIYRTIYGIYFVWMHGFVCLCLEPQLCEFRAFIYHSWMRHSKFQQSIWNTHTPETESFGPIHSWRILIRVERTIYEKKYKRQQQQQQPQQQQQQKKIA